MSRLVTLLSVGAFCLLLVARGATAQQAGADDIAIQMMRIVEIRMTQAGMALSSKDRSRVWHYVTKAAAEAYERNKLSAVVPEAEALADRLVETGIKRASTHPRAGRNSVTDNCRSRSIC